MEISGGLSPRTSPATREKPKTIDTDVRIVGLELTDNGSQPDHTFHPMNALEILRETVWVLRYNSVGFFSIASILICPVSAVALSNVLVDQSIVKLLTVRLLLIAKSSGLSLRPFVRQSVQKFSETVVSSTTCFPLYVSLLLLSKAAIVYSVDCTYSKRKFNPLKFYVIITKIWKKIAVTYLWACCLVSGCLTLFLVLLVSVCTTFSIMGFPSDLILYPAMIVGMIFSIILANCTIICSVAVVISVLEDVSGPQALLRSSSLIKGQTQVGLLIFLGSTMGMAFAEGLFEHRVKSLSYGDGSSRIWEGPLLVIIYSFVLLIDSMMSTVFYFSCKSYRMERANEESEPVLEALTIP